jgi:uncharacterized protein YkwD
VLLGALLATIFAAGSTRRAHIAGAAGDCVADERVDTEELAFLALVNQHRAQNGLPALGLSYTLSRAAAWKSRDLGVNRYFAHDDLSRTWVQRIRDCGYAYNTYIGENIAAGVSSAQGAFDLWKNSPGHNANMLGANYKTIGIGREYVAGSPYGWYWTTEFGGVDDGYAEIAKPTPIAALPPTPAPPVDTTPPRITLTSRGHGRTVTLAARTSDDVGVTRVEFMVDGVLVASDGRAPYAARVRLSQGAHTAAARAYDAAGNVGTASVPLRVR